MNTWLSSIDSRCSYSVSQVLAFVFVVHTSNCHGQNCTRRAIYRFGIDTLIANILVFLFLDSGTQFPWKKACAMHRKSQTEMVIRPTLPPTSPKNTQPSQRDRGALCQSNSCQLLHTFTKNLFWKRLTVDELPWRSLKIIGIAAIYRPYMTSY